MSAAPSILLLPTTDSVIDNWLPAYASLQEHGWQVFIVLDHAAITRTATPFRELAVGLAPAIQAARGRARRTALQWRLVRRARRLLQGHRIGAVVVSNDNAPVPNAFVNVARELGVATILHQGAGFMYRTSDPAHPANRTRQPSRLRRRLLRSSSDGRIGGHVDECWLQGRFWVDFVHNPRCRIVGNAHYRRLAEVVGAVPAGDRERFLREHGLDSTRPTVTFFSQPFGKLGVLGGCALEAFYRDVATLAASLGREFNFIFKPHPQEVEHRDRLGNGAVRTIERCDLPRLVAASDATVTVFSTMAVQSRVAGKVTIGWLPASIGPEYTELMRPLFHFASDSLAAVAAAVRRGDAAAAPDFHDRFDLGVDTAGAVEARLDALCRPSRR